MKALTEVQVIARSARSSDPVMQALSATNLHIMHAPPVLAERGSAGKLDTRWSKLQELRAIGCTTADAWLDENADQFRRSSTLTDDDLPEAVTV